MNPIYTGSLVGHKTITIAVPSAKLIAKIYDKRCPRIRNVTSIVFTIGVYGGLCLRRKSEVIFQSEKNGFSKNFFRKPQKTGLKLCVGSGIQIKKTERSPTRAAAQLAPPPDTPLKKMGFEKSIFSEKNGFSKN